MIVNQCYQMELEVVKQLTTSSVRDTLITVHSCINSMHPSRVAAALNNDLSRQLYICLYIYVFFLTLKHLQTLSRVIAKSTNSTAVAGTDSCMLTHTHTNNNF